MKQNLVFFGQATTNPRLDVANFYLKLYVSPTFQDIRHKFLELERLNWNLLTLRAPLISSKKLIFAVNSNFHFIISKLSSILFAYLLQRAAMLRAAAVLAFLSVRPSVRCRYCVKIIKRRMMLSPHLGSTVYRVIGNIRFTDIFARSNP